MFSQASVILSGGGGHAWQREAYVVKGDVHGKGGHVSQMGACVVKGDMHGKGACVARGTCMAKGVYMAKGCMHGKGGCAWQERWPLQQTVCILKECILVLLVDTHAMHSLTD